MKNKILDLIIVVSFIILLFNILINKQLVSNTISHSLDIWLNILIPSMFPFFVISDILINYNIVNYIPKFITNTFSYLFNISNTCTTIFFLSLISGFPSSARNIKTYYEKNLITLKEANHILLFTHFSNPIFILSTISLFFLNNEFYGYIILISHYLGNIIIGILLRNKSTIDNKNYTKDTVICQNFSKTLINSIKSSIDSLLLILGTLTSFLIISTFIIKYLNLPLYETTIIKGILEITMGLKDLSLLNINDIYKVIISTIFISFGGLSVHLQVVSNIVDTDIKYSNFFIARIYHAIISGIICYFLYKLFIF